MARPSRPPLAPPIVIAPTPTLLQQAAGLLRALHAWLTPLNCARACLFLLVWYVLYNAFFGAVVVWTQGINDPLVISMLWGAALLVEAVVAFGPLLFIDALRKSDAWQALIMALLFLVCFPISLTTAMVFQARTLQGQTEAAQFSEGPRLAAEDKLTRARDALARHDREVTVSRTQRQTSIERTPDAAVTARARLISADTAAKTQEDLTRERLDTAVNEASTACAIAGCTNISEAAVSAEPSREATNAAGAFISRGAEIGALIGVDAATADQYFSSAIALAQELFKMFGLLLVVAPTPTRWPTIRFPQLWARKRPVEAAAIDAGAGAQQEGRAVDFSPRGPTKTTIDTNVIAGAAAPPPISLFERRAQLRAGRA